MNLNHFLLQSRESLDKMSTKEQQINQLLDMGFGNNRVVRALQATEFKVSREFEKYFQLKDFLLSGSGVRNGMAAGSCR